MPLSITTSNPLPVGVVGQFYSVVIQYSGGLVTAATVTPGALPPGLTIGVTNNVVKISGTPTAVSTTESLNDSSGAPLTDDLGEVITVPGSGGNSFVVNMTAGTESESKAYNIAVSAAAGTAPFTVRELGALKYSGTYTAGDIFAIQRINNQIFYRKNGQVVHASALAVNTDKDNLHIKTDFKDQYGRISGLRYHRVGVPMTGTYFGSVLVHQIKEANIYSRIESNNDAFFQLSMIFRTSTYDNIASVTRASIKVRDKFGDTVVDFPPFSFTGSGVVGQGFHSRKYCDPKEEAIYEVRLATSTSGFSAPIYYTDYPNSKNGGNRGFSLIEPPLSRKVEFPQELVAAASSSEKVTLQWSHTAPVLIERKESSSWDLAASNVTSPYAVIGLSPLTTYDFRVRVEGRSSNIARATTLQQINSSETNSAPTGMAAAPASTSTVNTSWTRNSTINTGVELNVTSVDSNATIPLGAAIISHTVTGLTAGKTYSFRVRNLGPSVSNYSNAAEAKTPASVSTSNTPSGLNASASGETTIHLAWTNNVAGSINIEWSEDGKIFQVLTSGVQTVGQANYSDTSLKAGMTRYYRVGNTTQGFSNIASATTAIFNSGWTPESGETQRCVHFTSSILMANGTLKMAGEVVEGSEIMAYGFEGLISARVMSVSMGTSTTLYTINTESGRSLKCSPSHPLISNYALGTITASSLKLDDPILILEDREVITDRVKSIEILTGQFTVIIYEIDCPSHVFISDEILSHNLVAKEQSTL